MRYWLLLLYILFVKNAFAQHTAIGLPKMNMVYIGLENPITVAVEGVKAKDLHVEITGGALKGENGSYVFIPDGSIRLARLKAGVKKRGKIKWVDSAEYRVRNVPKPEVLFGTKMGGHISLGEVMTVSQVNAGLGEGFAYEGIKYNVTSYRITITGENIFYHEFVKGRRISAKTRNIFRRLKGGDKITIHNVTAVLSNLGTELNTLGPVELLVKGSRIPGNIIHKASFVNNAGTKHSFSSNETDFTDDDFFDNSDTVFKDGLWGIINLETNRPIHQSYYKKDTLLWTKTYFYDGSLKLHKIINHNNSTGTYIDYYENGSIFKQGKFLLVENFDLIVDKDCYLHLFLNKNSICELDDINECLIGQWKVFYENGKLKEMGNMDTTYTNKYYFIHKINTDDPNKKHIKEKEYPLIFSVRHGLWKFYDENGKLIRESTYEKGHIKEP